MPRKAKKENQGPLSPEALQSFAKHLSRLAGREMVFDPEAYGTEVYDSNRARYQFKVEGGKTSDYQGVCLLVTGDPSIYFIRKNRVEVIINLREERPREETVLAKPGQILLPAYWTVLQMMMAPYEGRV